MASIKPGWLGGYPNHRDPNHLIIANHVVIPNDAFFIAAEESHSPLRRRASQIQAA